MKQLSLREAVVGYCPEYTGSALDICCPRFAYIRIHYKVDS